MRTKFQITLANSAREWAEVLEQPFFQNIVDRLATKRPWEIEDVVEDGEAGWRAIARDGATVYTMSLLMPVARGDAPPHLIEWTLEAHADRDEPGKRSIGLVVFMLGMGAVFTWLGIRLGLPRALIPIVGLLGIFPVGLFLAVFLHHAATARRDARREREPVAARAEFLKEVAAAVAQLPTSQA